MKKANKNIMVLLFIFFITNTALYAMQKKCHTAPIIMYSIAKIEGTNRYPVGYPYIISINNKKDAQMLLNSNLKKYFINNRTINCQSLAKCKKITKYLINHKVKNLDCGAFQINYLYHKVKNLDLYFNLKKSYNFACNIIENNNKRVWTWKNIADYHSYSKKQNREYKQKLILAVYQSYKSEVQHD